MSEKCNNKKVHMSSCLKVCDGKVVILGDFKILEQFDKLDKLVKDSIFYSRTVDGTVPHESERITEVKWHEEEKMWTYFGSQKWMYSYLEKLVLEKELDKFENIFIVIDYNKNVIFEKFEKELKEISYVWYSELSSRPWCLIRLAQLVMCYEGMFDFNAKTFDLLVNNIEVISEECKDA